MKIINRTNKVLTYAAIDAESLFSSEVLTTEWIHTNQTHTKNMNKDSVTFYIVPGKHSILTNLSDTSQGYQKLTKFKNTTTVLFIEKGEGCDVIDWGAIRREQKNALEKEGNAPNSLAATAEVGQIIINALTTGLAATGPAGMAVLGIGSLLMMAMNSQATQPPPPPSLEQIQDAVRTVVKDELIKSKSEEFAVDCQIAANWLIEMARNGYGQMVSPGEGDVLLTLSTHDEVDFRENLEGFIKPQSRFQHALNYIQLHPKYSVSILPAYFTGLLADLQLRRMHILIRHLDGARISFEDLAVFRQQALKVKEIFSTGSIAFKTVRDKEISQYKLLGLPEGDDYKSLYNLRMTGINKFDEHVENQEIALGSIIDGLEKDLSLLEKGLPAQRFWRKDWEQLPKVVAGKGLLNT